MRSGLSEDDAASLPSLSFHGIEVDDPEGPVWDHSVGDVCTGHYGMCTRWR